MSDLVTGFRYLLKGQRWVARHGKQYGFGLLPGLLTLVLYLAALTALALYGTDLTTWATPFADDWSSPWLGLFRGFLTALLFALALLLSVLTFTAVTLLVGQPFYENLSEKVDRDVSPDGTAPESGLPLCARAVDLGPRQPPDPRTGPVLGGAALRPRLRPGRRPDRRPRDRLLRHRLLPHRGADRGRPSAARVELRERLALLRSRKLLMWGFGTPLALAFLVPFVAVFLMPGAVAGATLMARDLLGEETRDRPRTPTIRRVDAASRPGPSAGRFASARTYGSDARPRRPSGGGPREW